MANNRRRNIAIGIGVLVAVQAAAIALYFTIERDGGAKSDVPFRVERLGDDTPAPDIALERADGSRLSVHAVGGPVRLVHFWATWCPPCVDELPGLLATSRELASRGLTLIAISMDDDWPAIREFFDGDIPAEVYRAVDNDAHKRYDVYSLPDTYLVRQQAQLLLRYGGARDWRGPAAREHLILQLR